MNKKFNINVYVPFTKSDDDQRMVYGYCTSESLDSQGEIILRDAIIKAWDKYMEFANVREMHQASAVGVTKEYTHDENGTWIGVKVVDDKAWKFVKEGVYKGFSIGGRVVKQKKNIIEEIILSEISLVDRPANPDAKFSVSKVDDGLVDQLQLEANNFNMKKFVEIDGVKYVEDPENEGKPLVDETTGENVLYVEEGEEEKIEEKPEEKPEEKEEEKPEEKIEEEKPEEKKEEEPKVEDKIESEEQKADKSWMKKAESAGLLTKDSGGVMLLADLLSHFEFVAECFGDDAEDVQMLLAIKTAIMSAIQMESKEPEPVELSEKTKDLSKMFGSELSKAVAPLVEKMGSFEKSLSDVVKDVEAIKNTKVSPRPKSSIVVDKTIQNADNVNKGAKGLVEKRQELEKINEEISSFALEWGPKVQADPSLTATFMSKSAELHNRYSDCKRELNEMLSESGGI